MNFSTEESKENDLIIKAASGNMMIFCSITTTTVFLVHPRKDFIKQLSFV